MQRKKPTKKKTDATKIEVVRHKDKRKNIPTEELRDFVADEENNPQKILYPRNPDLDPQLVWKGKDAQDSEPLEVPAVPIYIQEKIHPQAIIEDFKHGVAQPDDDGKTQLTLFGDFNGLPEDFDKRVDFYHHEGNWSNRLVLGDSLLVMTSLAEKEGLKGKVQMVYMDPPYGIRFGSNWQVSTRRRDVKDGKAEEVTRQPEQVQAFRDTWKLGIHTYLPYMRDRLAVARDLLTESGSIFVQIGDENVHLVRCLMDEVFGKENFFAQIAFKSTNPLGSSGLSKPYDYIVWYAKDIGAIKYRPLLRSKDIRDDREYRFFEDVPGPQAIRRVSDDELRDMKDFRRIFRRQKLTSSGYTATCTYNFELFGRTCKPMARKSWSTNQAGMVRLIKANRLFFTGENACYKRYFGDAPFQQFDNCWSDMPGGEEQLYVVQTGTKFIERCLLLTTDPGDLVLDPTCGSGTTACVAEQWGRRWITMDTSRVALTLARTRLMAARFPYYLLVDSPEGSQKESEIVGHPSSSLAKSEEDVRKGFVYKRVPHITLKAIANNEEIDDIHARWQEGLDPVRTKLNKISKKKWEEWDIPRESENGWSKEAIALLKEWWDLRQQRQQEIDASVARRAETEVLVDQPYEDNKRVRVAGPFTVESLSPHRTISVEEKKRIAEVGDAASGLKIKTLGPDQFGNMILENLRTAGVQNTVKKERLRFDCLQPYPGQWIHGEGTYTDGDGKNKRVAVCIGPEHGTVGPQLVKEAAKEAVQGVGFDLLIVCGFAFDPHVTEEAKRYGKLVVLPTRMNPDLTMGELLKKTGSGNLFMVFGEPDLDVQKQKDGQIVVTINGLDIYDPTTGEIRSSSTDDIACWLLDTNYNGESFFVRHAYFTGADEPYEKLKRALRADIDEAAWSALYSTTSRPFDMPESGRIAVKVINHYGDEVLKVFEV
jgi:adenine-specific DNA-methyltransferase